MLQHKKILRCCTALFILYLQSCTKAEIEFGNDTGESYTKIARVDSVRLSMSTYFLDSFATSKTGSLLLGRYKDPELGLVSAKPYLQLTVPAVTEITADAVYDSLTLVLRLNKKYYGDSSKAQTIQVKELAAPVEYSYSSFLYNTSSIEEKTGLLGSKTLYVKPNTDDSIVIRLSDAKGAELFGKIKQQSAEVLNQDAFLKYLKGISIGYPGTDGSLVLGLKDSVCLRLHYHHTNPYPEALSIDMETYTNGIYFNQLLYDHAGTPLATLLTGSQREIPASQLGNKAYSQGTAGTLLKVGFPGVRALLQSDSTLVLLSATLVLKAEAGSFDYYKLRLPEQLLLVTTDASNVLGGELSKSDGTVIYGYPVADFIYNTPSYYSFDITSYINSNIRNSNTDDHALFVQQNYAGSNDGISRAVFSNDPDPAKGSQLLLSFLTIKQ